MKKLIVLIMLLVFVLCSGCSMFGPRVIDPNYAAYERIMVAQFEAERQPLLDLSLGPDGKVTNIQMYPQSRHIKVEQKKSSAWFKLAEVAVRYLGYVGIIWQTGDALEDIVDSAKGNSTYMNSYNNNSENAGTISSQADYATTKTDTVDTTVESSE